MFEFYNHSSEKMNEIENESTHLIVTSPPYPMIEKWDKCFGKIDFKYQHSILTKVWKECYRILIPGGICCINIGDATRKLNNNFQCFHNFSQIQCELSNMGFNMLIPVLWKKISNRPNAFLGSGFLPPNAYVSQDIEYIIICRKGNLRTFPPKDKNRYDSKITKEERDLWFQQIWDKIPGRKGSKEDSSFPEEIPYRLIKMFSVINDIIVDPFCGTGTTGIVANKLKRNFIGYDIKTSKLNTFFK